MGGRPVNLEQSFGSGEVFKGEGKLNLGVGGEDLSKLSFQLIQLEVVERGAKGVNKGLILVVDTRGGRRNSS